MKFLRDNAQTLLLLACVGGAALAPLGAWMAFVYAPEEAVMGAPQRIFYFHVPVATFCYVGFFITFAGSIGYLWTKDMAWDRWAVAGAEVGVMLASLMMLTGMLWARPIWGAWWTWDPRLTTSLVLWLIFVGYLILRSQVDDETTRAKFAAVMGIVGYADVPLVHYSVKLWSRGIHPPKPELHPDMKTALLFGFAAVACMFAVTLILRVRLGFAAAALARLKGAGRH
ncbi:MAG: cytochrome c biogenesis protein CcsA [Nitrospinae bacterium]|nr:cytochrome c biogenesis protein CcsA [Nitrospinota bacterium]